MSRQHSLEKWEQQRPLIKRLYIDEKMPLPKLMLTMEESGFYATKKLYKNWIKTWNLRKNLKLEEKEALLRKQRKRKMRENKETVFWMNGDVIPLDRLIRHEKQSQKEEEEEENNFLEVASSAADTPSCVCYQTPPGGSPKEPDAQEPEMFSDLQLELPNRLGQALPCLACRRYEGLVADASKMDLQRHDRHGSIRSHDSLDAMGPPRAYSQSLRGPIDASSQAATRAFMYLSEGFEEVKRISDIINRFNSISFEPILKLFRLAAFLSQRDILIAAEPLTRLQSQICITAEKLEFLVLLETIVAALRSALSCISTIT